MARPGASKTKKSPRATALSQLKKELKRVTEQLESRDRELEQRNAELREALEHQNATAEVLGIISRSPPDVQPVLDAIVESAARVCGIDRLVLRLREGNAMVPRAHFGPAPITSPEISADEPPHFRWMREHGTLHVPDTRAQNEFPKYRFRRELSHLSGRCPSSAGRTYWDTDRTSHRGASVYPGADQTSRNLRRPSRDRASRTCGCSKSLKNLWSSKLPRVRFLA